MLHKTRQRLLVKGSFPRVTGRIPVYRDALRRIRKRIRMLQDTRRRLPFKGTPQPRVTGYLTVCRDALRRIRKGIGMLQNDRYKKIPRIRFIDSGKGEPTQGNAALTELVLAAEAPGDNRHGFKHSGRATFLKKRRAA
jgi:hypothetical protein